MAGNVTVSVPGPLSPILTLTFSVGTNVRRRRDRGARRRTACCRRRPCSSRCRCDGRTVIVVFTRARAAEVVGHRDGDGAVQDGVGRRAGDDAREASIVSPAGSPSRSR